MAEHEHEGHRERLKTGFLKGGLDGFSDVNCLELLLFYAIPRRDTNPIAHRLLDHFGSLSGVLGAPVEELCRVPGVGRHAAILLHAIPALAQRYMVDQTRDTTILHDNAQCAAYLQPRFLGAREELVYLLCMDAKGKLLDCRLISRGSFHAADICIRNVVDAVFHTRASVVTLAHNHVSGLALPSAEDLATTKKLNIALDAVGVTLLDHLIFCENEYISLADSGLLR